MATNLDEPLLPMEDGKESENNVVAATKERTFSFSKGITATGMLTTVSQKVKLLMPETIEDDEERLTLGPIAKFRKYKKIPWKLIIHMVLIISICLQVYFYVRVRQPYLSAATKTFVETFLPEGYEDLEDSTSRYHTFHFYNMDDIVEDVEKTVKSFYSFVETNVDTFSYIMYTDKQDVNNTVHIVPPLLEIQLTNQNKRDVLRGLLPIDRFVTEMRTTHQQELSLDDPLGLFDEQQSLEQLNMTRRQFFDHFVQARMLLTFESLEVLDDPPECIHWIVEKRYGGDVGGGTIPAILFTEYGECVNIPVANAFSIFLRPITWSSFFVLALSIVSLFLSIKSSIHRGKIYLTIKRKRQIKANMQYYSSVEEAVMYTKVSDVRITPRDIPKFMNAWLVFTLASDITHIISCTTLITSRTYGGGSSVNTFGSVVLSASAILALIKLIRYFQYTPKFYVLILTLSRGLPNVFRFVLGSIPIFFGYALAGTVLFGHYAKYFQDIDNSMVTLFSLIHGDAMHEIFDMIYGYSPFLAYTSRAYIYTFTLLFICAVLNIFILIMEDAYMNAAKPDDDPKTDTIGDHTTDVSTDVGGHDTSHHSDDDDKAGDGDDNDGGGGDAAEQKSRARKSKKKKISDEFTDGSSSSSEDRQYDGNAYLQRKMRMVKGSSFVRASAMDEYGYPSTSKPRPRRTQLIVKRGTPKTGTGFAAAAARLYRPRSKQSVTRRAPSLETIDSEDSEKDTELSRAAATRNNADDLLWIDDNEQEPSSSSYHQMEDDFDDNDGSSSKKKRGKGKAIEMRPMSRPAAQPSSSATAAAAADSRIQQLQQNLEQLLADMESEQQEGAAADASNRVATIERLRAALADLAAKDTQA